jgi:hypothetical protein
MLGTCRNRLRDILECEMPDDGKLRQPTAGSDSKTRVMGVLLLLVPLSGCLGLGDLFREKPFIAGDYFLMEGERDTTDDLYLFNGDNPASVAGPLSRIGWNQQYIVFVDARFPTQWNVITVKEHSESKITDAQRTQDSRFQHILVRSSLEAWQRAKAQNPN